MASILHKLFSVGPQASLRRPSASSSPWMSSRAMSVSRCCGHEPGSPSQYGKSPNERTCESRRMVGIVSLSSGATGGLADRKSTRLNSSHGYISYAVFCLKKKKKTLEHLLQMTALAT